jgi:Mn-dependent DtxR family transcriptional regulator
MAQDNKKVIEKKLDTLIELQQQLLALELSRSGVTQKVIGKRLHVAKATVVEMLKGVKKEG